MTQDSLRWRVLSWARRTGLVCAGKTPVRKAILVLALLLSSAIPFQSVLAAAASVSISGPAEVTGASFEVTVTFSEGVTGFAQSDVTVGNGSATGFTADSATVYRVTIAPTAGYNGSVTVDVPAGVAQSVSDNANNLAATQFSTTATFASACTTGSAVTDKTNTGLIADCAALLAGEDTLKGTAALNWDANTSISSWDGTVVGGTPQRVFKLELSSRGLNGVIPAQLGNLTELQVLKLSVNELSGSIPEELGNLSKLATLTLSVNELTGNIPEELGNLSALIQLTLNTNQLSGSIPDELGNLTALTGLYLFDNELTGSIPDELGNLSALMEFALNGNQLSGSIPSSLGNLSSQKLTALQLESNGLTGNIPKELGNLAALRTLRLDQNELSGSIPSSLGNLSSQKLTALQLESNGLTGNIPKELGNLAALRTLRLDQNELSGSIPVELGNLAALTNLRLDNNQLTGTIPAELGMLTQVQYLYLYNNQLTGGIPTELGNLAALTYLRLDNNQLTGTIPAELGNLSALTWLLMPDNRLSGSIPAELGKLTNVQYLWLHCNQFTSSIPYSLGALTALSEADFRGNQLTGGIPASMAGLPVKLDEGIACAGAQPGGTTTDNSRSNRPPRLTVTLTCPAGPLTEGDTLRCTLTLKNSGGQTLTNITWRLPTLAIGPQMLPTVWPWERPGELEPGRSIRMKLAYGPLSPRRGAAELALSQVLGDGTATQPTRMAVPWPASLPLTVIADSEETDAATVTHVVDVRELAPAMLLALGERGTETADEDSVEDEVGVRDEVNVKATAGPPSTALLRVELRRNQDPASDGQSSHYTLVITNASRYRWLTGLHWRIPSLRIRRQVGDKGRLRPGETAIVQILPQSSKFRREPTILSVIVASRQTGAVALTHVADARAPGAETFVGGHEPMAAQDQSSVTGEDSIEGKVLATAMSGRRGSPLQVELRGSEEPVAAGQDAHYTLIITNTSRYWLLTNLHWQSPSLGIGRQAVDDGTLSPGETVVLRLAYGPARFRWQPAAVATGRDLNIRNYTVRLEPLNLQWPEPLPLMITVSGKRNTSEPEYRRVTTHASYVSALHAPPLMLKSVPGPAGQPASVAFAAARDVRVVPAALPLDLTFQEALSPYPPLKPMYRLVADFLGGVVYPLPQIRAPGGLAVDTFMTAHLFVAPPAPLERVPVGSTTAMLHMTPMVRIGGQFIKRREYRDGVVQSLIGHTVTRLSLRDGAGAAITHLDWPLELSAYLPGPRLPPGVTPADVYWARWNAIRQQWQPLPTRTSGRLLISVTQQPGLFAVIAATPPSRDLKNGLRYYYPTGKHVGFAFKEYFDAHGGVARFGYPVTNEFQRAGLTVQYFEKARFEYRPQLAGTPHAVMLGLLGDELLTLWDAHEPREAEPTGELPPTMQYFPETGHYVGHGFLAYFNANGGVERFGFPVTEELYDPSLGRTVQYFQRQRLAWNAETGRVEEMPDLARILILAGDPVR